MRILSWNISHGGGARLAGFIEGVAAYDADFVALTEFRAEPGKALCGAFRERDYSYVETPSRGERHAL
jgi:hypothetical protein